MILEKSFCIGLNHFKALNVKGHTVASYPEQLFTRKPIFSVSSKDLGLTTSKKEVGTEGYGCVVGKDGQRPGSSDDNNEDSTSGKEDNCSTDSALELFAGDYNNRFCFFLRINPTFQEKIKSSSWKNSSICTELNVISTQYQTLPSSMLRQRPSFSAPLRMPRQTSEWKYKSQCIEISEASKVIPIECGNGHESLTDFKKLILNRKLSNEVTWKIEIHSDKLENKGENFVFKKLYKLDDTKDVTFVVAHGAEIKAHESVLTAQSEKFQAMLSPQTKMIAGQTGRVDLPENTEDGVELFVKFLYSLDIRSTEVRITSSLALELLKLSHKFGVTDLEEFMKGFLSQKPAEYYSPNALLELFCFTRNVEKFEGLSKYSATLLSALSEAAIQSCDYFKEKMNKEEALSLLFVFNRK